MSIVAVLPARGGSKGIPRKNIKLLAGKPLIAWTIEAALAARSVDLVLTSTDDEEIAQVARKNGAQVPFLRPLELASDTASSEDVALHALSWLQQNERSQVEFVLLLQPSSPLRSAEDIEAAIALQRDKRADAVVSVCETSHPFQWFKNLGPNRELLPWQTGAGPSRRQDARPVYQLNGAIYLVRSSVVLKEKTFFPERTFGYLMPPEKSLDIDTPWEFYLAELILKDQRGSSFY